LGVAVVAACAHAEAAELEAGPPEGDFIHRRAFGRRFGAEQFVGGEGESAGGGGAFEELAAAAIRIHKLARKLTVGFTTALGIGVTLVTLDHESVGVNFK
jgi:hypothetical protein